SPAHLSSHLQYFHYINAAPETYTLSLHDALPIYSTTVDRDGAPFGLPPAVGAYACRTAGVTIPDVQLPVLPEIGSVLPPVVSDRSEEHTSELQSQSNLVCRLLLEKKHKDR